MVFPSIDRLVETETRTFFPVKVDKVVVICSCEKDTLESMMKTYRIYAWFDLKSISEHSMNR